MASVTAEADNSSSSASTTSSNLSTSLAGSSSTVSEPPPPSAVITCMNGSKSGTDDDKEQEETLPSLDYVTPEEEQTTRTSRLLDAPRRYFRYALTLWILEILSVIALKHLGFLEKEFRLDTVMTQKVLPRINDSIPIGHLTQERKRPGFLLAQQGAEANYPVVMVPGFVTSGLEVWSGKECAKGFFRQRLWAALTGARSFLLERDCWREHMMLDPLTGGDPEGIKVRAAQGFEAADYFLVSYWVWAKLIENLADVGYTPSTMTMEPYDWRLSFPMLEKRDGYLTKLKSKIEAMHKTTGKKVVLTSHSMGANLVHYFFAWVTAREQDGGGGGGRKWVHNHIHSYVNIAGAHLGVPKAATALLSGEMSDTVLTGMIKNMAEQFFGRRRRRDLWNSWGSLWSMLPKGGSAIWGVGADLGCADNDEGSDPFCRKDQVSPLLKMQVEEQEKDPATSDGTQRQSKLIKDFISKESMSVENVLGFIREYGAGLGPDTAATRDMSLFGEERRSSRIWHDPTRTPLPYAPDMKIYCLYGVGVETERVYYYKRKEVSTDSGENNDEFEPPVVLDSDVHDPLHKTEFGIRYADGDGSVPLLSLGYMCTDAWRRPETGLNPSNSKVVTREYQHKPGFSVEDPMRGGPGSADHVDVLGNIEMMEDFLKVVTGFNLRQVAQDRIVSDIASVAEKVNLHGGVKRPNRNWIEWIHR